MPGTAITTKTAIAAHAIASDPKRYQDAGGKWLPASQIAELLCTVGEIPNPEPQLDIPANLDVDEAISLLSVETCVKLAAAPPIVDFVEKANAGNRDGAMRWIGFAAKAGIITPAESKSLAMLAGKTLKDPEWKPFVPGSPVLDSIDAATVEAALREVQL